MEEGFERARNVMARNIRTHIIKQIGGDTVSSLNIKTKYDHVTFKQMLCPLYNGSYQINKKRYLFVINGQNGKFYGKYPKSAMKISILIFVILLLITGIVLFFLYS